MDKYERNIAADLILNYSDFRNDTAEIKLECGMTVRCKNTTESLKNLSDRIRKGFRVRNPHLPSKPRAASSYASAIKSFIDDGEFENAREYAALHGRSEVIQ